MAQTATDEIGIRIKVYDETSGAFKDVEAKVDRAAFAFNRAGGAANNTAQSFNRFRENVSKGGAALGLLGRAAGGMGGQVGQAMNALTGLASAAMSGGAAIAAVTAAIGVATVAWQAYQDRVEGVARVERATEVQRAKGLQEWMKIETERIKELEALVRNHGKESLQIELETKRARMATLQEYWRTNQEASSQAKADAFEKSLILSEEVKLLEKLIAKEREVKLVRGAKSPGGGGDFDMELATTEWLVKQRTEAIELGYQRRAELADAGRQYERALEEQRTRDLEEQSRERREILDRENAARVETSLAIYNTTTGYLAAVSALAGESAATQTDVSRRVLSTTVEVVKRTIMAYAAQAAAAQIAANSYLGLAGLVVGTAAASAAFGYAEAYLADVPEGYARGGLVRGGAPGVDSVAARLMPGEVVVPANVVKAISQGQSGFTAAGGGGSQVVVNQTFQTALPTTAEVRRQLREAAREIDWLRGKGLV